MEENISGVMDATRKYINAQIKLFKLELLERISKVVSLIIYTSAVVMIGCLFVLFICIAAAIFIGHLMHSMELGFLILSAFFLVLMAILWSMRKKIVINRVIRSLDEILFVENESENEEE